MKNSLNEITILLADDHTLLRAGIRSLLEKINGLKVVGEAGDGREALAKIKKLKPDVALIDISMPELNGLELTRILHKDLPEVGVIILSMHTDDGYVLKALNYGAYGYILKDAAPSELEIAVNAVAKKEKYLTPSISKKIIDGYVTADNFEMEKLTHRQREVLQLLAEGNTVKEIAFKLKVSIKTAEAHRKQIMDRLNIHDLPGLVKYAIKNGITVVE